jgi:hypothetical protein
MLPFIVPVTTRESLEFEKELLEELLEPLESRAAVEVLPNVQYSFGHLTHAGPLRVRDGTVYSTKYAGSFLFWTPRARIFPRSAL